MPEAVPISARIVPWDDGLGVAYTYPEGKHSAHPIEDGDWPIIRGLQAAGKLTYTNDTVRALFAEKERAGGGGGAE